MPLVRDITSTIKLASNGATVEILNPNETDPAKSNVLIVATSFAEAVKLEAAQKATIDPSIYPLKPKPVSTPATVVPQPVQIQGKAVGAAPAISEPVAQTPIQPIKPA
jgi:hypothetical protein